MPGAAGKVEIKRTVPKNKKTCSSYNAQVENGYLQNSDDYYLVGEKVQFSCRQNYLTKDKQKNGERECLPNGKFTEDQCSKTCSSYNAQVENGYLQNSDDYYLVGEKVQFSCRQNYLTKDKQKNGERECLPNGKFTEDQCSNIPCSPPPEIENGVLTGYKKNQYASGEKVRYGCNNGYVFEKKTNEKSEAICEETQWKSIPVCRKIGERCGPAPVVQYGDYLGPKQNNYTSGYIMQYKCPKFYKTEGETLVRCENGVWGDPPVCLEPCTANAKDMKENNIEFKWISLSKLYMEHDDAIIFRCNYGYEISNPTHLRVKCNRGVILYPKCTKIGEILI
ncbi:Hypothetical predicted protein [Pelobates cultripes]|uniref:Sushi domain-containing protein n=1 Tax=Pelobates cultripes TaxID=61616 RepID=A0AAD1WIH2_PELCU|nr:Hypothetical predicted protein [Pelobates cultripes]